MTDETKNALLQCLDNPKNIAIMNLIQFFHIMQHHLHLCDHKRSIESTEYMEDLLKLRKTYCSGTPELVCDILRNFIHSGKMDNGVFFFQVEALLEELLDV